MELLMEYNGTTNDEVIIEGYFDADWAGDSKDRKSVSDIMIKLNSMAVPWHARKQSMVTLYTAEVEYISCVDVIKDVMGLQQLLMEINVRVRVPMTIYRDNQATITQITCESSSKRSKHMDVRFKFVVDVVAKGITMMKYLPSERMPADLMMKALSYVNRRTQNHVLSKKKERWRLNDIV